MNSPDILFQELHNLIVDIALLNLKTRKKTIPVVSIHTKDDDTIYDKDLIKNLVNDYHIHKCVICYRGFTFKFNELSDITYEDRCYKKLNFNIRSFRLSKG